jgi:hypothetical protein
MHEPRLNNLLTKMQSMYTTTIHKFTGLKFADPQEWMGRTDAVFRELRPEVRRSFSEIAGSMDIRQISKEIIAPTPRPKLSARPRSYLLVRPFSAK